MRRLLIVLAGLLALLILFTLTAYLIGRQIPVEHEVSLSEAFDLPADSLWAVLVDYRNYPRWRKDITKVEILAEEGEKAMWREYDQFSQNLTYRTVDVIVDSMLVIETADREIPYKGRWKIVIEQFEGKCRVTITEHGQVFNPMLRFMMKYFFSEDETIKTYLSALKSNQETSVANSQ